MTQQKQEAKSFAIEQRISLLQSKFNAFKVQQINVCFLNINYLIRITNNYFIKHKFNKSTWWNCIRFAYNDNDKFDQWGSLNCLPQVSLQH